MSLSFLLYSIYKRIFHYLVNFIFWVCNRNKRRIVPNSNDSILNQSAVYLAQQIQSGKLKFSTVVEAFIRRIKGVNPIINALVDERFNEALGEAKLIDKKLANGSFSKEELKKMDFFRVPFTTKESIHCKGLSLTFGLISRKGLKAKEDADAVSLMKRSGAILLGVWDVPEINMWIETYNLVFGKTNNLYDITRKVGGSIGGDAALIASLGTPIAVGTDIAGSVRVPSFRCGIFGHKPTNDLISMKGMMYRDGTEGPTMVTPGVMAKKSEDLLPLLKIITENSAKLNLHKGEVDITKIRILYTTSIECFFNGPIGKDNKNSVKKCADYFEGYSETKPKDVHIKCLDYGFKLWLYSKNKEATNFQSEIKNQREEASFSKEFYKWLTGQGEHTLYTLMILLKLSIAPLPGRSEVMENLIREARQELMQVLGDDGVLILPPERCPAEYHYSTLLEPTTLGFYSIFNVLKFPVTQVPIGLNSEGVPLGVQVAAAPFNDKLTIALAAELEKAFGGYVQPLPV